MDLGYTTYPVEDAADLEKELEAGNPTGVLLVYGREDAPQLGFLAKIISAIGLGMDEVSSLALEGRRIAKLPNRLGNTDIVRVIVFGIPPQQVCWNASADKYRLSTRGGKQWLFADALSDIAADKALKKELWLALKAMFGV